MGSSHSESVRVSLEIAPGHDTAQGRHDPVAERPAVDDLDSVAADPPERGGEIRLRDRRADGRGAAAVEIRPGGLRVQMREVLVEHLAVERGQRRPGFGQLGGGLEHVAERQGAVVGENTRPAGQVAGDGHGQRPARVVGAMELLAAGAGRGAPQEIEDLRPVAGAGEDENAASREAGHVGLRHADRGRRRDQGVDRVAAAGEHAEPRERGERVCGRHHAASPEGNRPEAEPRGVRLVGRGSGLGRRHA